MARLHTSGFEESLAQSDLSLTVWDSASGTITVTAPPVARGQSQTCAEFTTAVEGHVTKSLTTGKSAGSLYTRVYALWTGFGAAASGVVFRWVDGSGNNGIVVRYIGSTGKFRLENYASGALVSVDSSYVASVNTWIRLELQILLSSTTSGGATLNIYNGDSATAADSITLASQATAGTVAIATLNGCEIGNRSTADFGTLYLDDIAINDDDTSTGDGQTSWCGPGSIFLVKPATTNTKPVQWSASGSSTARDAAQPNLLRPNMGLPNGTAVTAGVVTNQSNIDDVPGAPDDATTYNFISDAVSVDRFDITPAPSALPDATNFTLIDVYGRVGSTSTSLVTMSLTVWDDGGFQNDGPALFMNTSGWQRTKSGEHNVASLVGVTKTKLNQYSIGYKSLSGSGIERRVSALWANVEYKPDTSLTITQSLVHNYNALTPLSKQLTHNYNSAVAVLLSLVTNYNSAVSRSNSAGSPWTAAGFVAVVRALTHIYESLKGVSQAY